MRAGVIRPYKPAKHRTYRRNRNKSLVKLQEKKIRVSMSPHAVDVVRGILCTQSHIHGKKDIDEKELVEACIVKHMVKRSLLD